MQSERSYFMACNSAGVLDAETDSDYILVKT